MQLLLQVQAVHGDAHPGHTVLLKTVDAHSVSHSSPCELGELPCFHGVVCTQLRVPTKMVANNRSSSRTADSIEIFFVEDVRGAPREIIHHCYLGASSS